MARHYFTDGDKLKSLPLDNPQPWIDAGIFGEWGLEKSTITAPKAFDTVGWVGRCVELRADSLSAMPWSVFQRDNEVATHDEPEHAKMPWLEDLGILLYLAETGLCINGYGYGYKVRNRGGRVDALRWFAPSTMTPVWDTTAGLVGFDRKLSSGTFRLSAEDVLYFALPNSQHETEPAPGPVAKALADAGVIVNLNRFAAAFFERGAIRATILTIDGNPPESERLRVKSWWQRVMAGIGNAFAAEVVSARLAPVVIGDGVETLNNAELTAEKREAISTALGVPHSLVMSNAANYATAQADRTTFYETTVIPAAGRIARVLNRGLFGPLGYTFRFQPESMPLFQKDENERAQAFATYVNAGMPPALAAEMLGLTLPPGWEYADLTAPAPVVVQALPAPTEPDQEPEPETEPAPMRALPQRSEAWQREAGQFRKWLRKRGAKADPGAFDAEHLSDGDKTAIAAEAAGAEMRPFSTTPSAKALILQLDPDDPDAEGKRIDDLLRRHLRDMEAALTGVREDLYPRSYEGFPSPMEEAVRVRREMRASGKLRKATEAMMTDAASTGVTVAADTLAGVISAGFDWHLVNEGAAQWARARAATLIDGIADTTADFVRREAAAWIESDSPLDVLIERLGTQFAPERAQRIAVTEITRAFAAANEDAYQQSGVVQYKQWQTRGLGPGTGVCIICQGLQGQIVPLGTTFEGGYDRPPAHPGCFCWIVPVVTEIGIVDQGPARTPNPKPPPAPRAAGPSGTPVSAALKIPVGGKYSRAYRETLDAIDSVHGAGWLPEIPITASARGGVLGSYNHIPGRGAHSIAISGKGTHQQLTLAHEVGHFLDHMGLANSADYGGAFATSHLEELSGWRDAVKNSSAFKRLAEMRQDPAAHARQVTASWGTYVRTPDKKHLAYLMSEEELWARSYAQYIAKKSGNKKLLSQLAGELGDELYGDRHWADDDFAPIEAAIDKLFEALGWRK